jgi:hypothetical protein
MIASPRAILGPHDIAWGGCKIVPHGPTRAAELMPFDLIR